MKGSFLGIPSFFFGNAAITGSPNEGNDYELRPNQRIIIGVNFASWRSNLNEDIFHELVHGGGVIGRKSITAGKHDLYDIGAKYDKILEGCN